MKKKMRRFEEGGFLTKQGKNENISDETRERARKFVEDKEENIKPKATSRASTPTVKSSSTAPKTAPKAESKPTPKAETAEENKERMEGLTKKQALEKVEPEGYIPGPGMLKNVLKRGLKSVEQKLLPYNPKKATVEKAREARANARMNKMREENADAGPPGRARASGPTNDMGGTFKEYEIRSDFKKGGKVSSASKRADGCAIRGKTRA
jgi:hypothetical protein